MSSAWLQDQIHVSARDLVQKNKWGGSCRMAHLRPCGLTYTSTHEHTNNCTYTTHKSAHKYLHMYHKHKSTWILAHIAHTHTTQRTQIHTHRQLRMILDGEPSYSKVFWILHFKMILRLGPHLKVTLQGGSICNKLSLSDYEDGLCVSQKEWQTMTRDDTNKILICTAFAFLGDLRNSWKLLLPWLCIKKQNMQLPIPRL